MQKPIFWILTFIIILALAVLVLFYSGQSRPLLFGFPDWLLYFFGVEVLFCAAFYLFTQKFWTTEE